LAPPGLGQRRQRRFAVAHDGEIDLLVTPEVLIIGFYEKVAGAERDQFGALSDG
jgi:hypothetical protein